MARNRSTRTKPFTTIRVRIPSSDMKLGNDLLYNSNGREHGGVLEIVNRKGVYTAHIVQNDIVKGHSKKFMTNVPEYKNGVYISFHTHPNMAYKKLGCVLGAPSIPDYKMAFQRSLLGETAHVIFTIEGMYVIRMQEGPLRFFRDLIQSRLFTTKQNGIGYLMQTLGIIDTVMGPKERNRFVQIKNKDKKFVEIQGNNQLRVYVQPNGTKHQNADFIVRNLSRSNVDAIRSYAKQLYKDTMKQVRTIRVSMILDSMIDILRSQGLTDDHVRMIDNLLQKYPGVRNESVFHTRLYHRSLRVDHSCLSLISDYSKPISFTILVDDVNSIRKMSSSPVREEFTARTTSPESFTRMNTSPYTRKRNRGSVRETPFEKKRKLNHSSQPRSMNID